MITVNLVQVQLAHFGCSEATLYRQFVTPAIEKRMKPGDAFCFVAMSGNQMLFVYKKFEDEVLISHRLRLDSGVWNPEMMQNYAAKAGMKLLFNGSATAIPTFEQIHARREKSGGRTPAKRKKAAA